MPNSPFEIAAIIYLSLLAVKLKIVARAAWIYTGEYVKVSGDRLNASRTRRALSRTVGFSFFFLAAGMAYALFLPISLLVERQWFFHEDDVAKLRAKARE